MTGYGKLIAMALTSGALAVSVGNQELGVTSGGSVPGGNLCIDAPITDAAPLDLTVNSAHCYAPGTQTASDLILGGGIDENTITIDDWNNCGTDTVTLTVNQTATVLTEGTEWTAATSDTATAASLATAVSAVSGVSATSAAAVVYVQPDNCSAYYLDMAEGDATCTTLAEGTDGKNLIVGPIELLTATDEIRGSSSTVLDFTADGVLRIRDTTRTKGAQIYAGAADSLTLRNIAGTGDSSWYVNGRERIRMNTDVASDGAYNLSIDSISAAEFIASSGNQYSLKMEPEIAQSGTAAFKAIYINVTTDGSPGSGQDYLLDLNWGGTPMFQVQDDGDTVIVGTLDTQAGRIINVTTVNDTNYTALVGDHLIAYTALTVARTVELPDALCNDGRTWDVKDEAGNAAAANIVIDPEGGTTIDGVANISITADYNSLTVYCRNSVWFTR